MRLAPLFVLVLAGPALAEGGPRPAQISALVGAIEAAGCVVNEGNQSAVLKAAGLTPNEGAAVVVRLMAEGRAVGEGDDVLRLTTGACK